MVSSAATRSQEKGTMGGMRTGTMTPGNTTVPPKVGIRAVEEHFNDDNAMYQNAGGVM